MNSEPSLRPSMAVEIPGTITGPQVIADLLDRIADRLERCGDLRAVDCYRGYSARVRIDLQLADVYPVEIASEVTVGVIDPQLPVRQVALGADAAGTPDDSESLERPIDADGFTPQAPAKRMYVSRVRRRE